MAPKTHVIKGEDPGVEDFELGVIDGGRTSVDIAQELTRVHEEILSRKGKILGHYSLRPANSEHGDQLFIVVDYPDFDVN